MNRFYLPLVKVPIRGGVADVGAQIKYRHSCDAGGWDETGGGFKGWPLIWKTTQILSDAWLGCRADVTHLPGAGVEAALPVCERPRAAAAAAGDI